MTSPRQTHKPAFLWQAGLILLPVVIMAAVALRAIIQSRAEVEREARQRAEKLARQYAKTLEESTGPILLQRQQELSSWHQCIDELGRPWPWSKTRAQWLAPQWPPFYPGPRAEEVFPDWFTLTPDGRFG
jgi:hypothetical protein